MRYERKLLHYTALEIVCKLSRLKLVLNIFHNDTLYCIVLYCIVLRRLSLLPNALRPFQIYCAPSNLGITRTWICRLNFAQRTIFQAWGSLTSLKSQTRDPQLKVPPGGLVLRIFMSWKIHRPQPGLNPRTLDLEASTLPLYYRGRLWYILRSY